MLHRSVVKPDVWQLIEVTKERTVRRKDVNSPAGKVDYLLHNLCVEWGFCAGLSAERLFQAHPTLTGGLFARAVLEAEGMNPDLEKAWLRRVGERFTERFGLGTSLG